MSVDHLAVLRTEGARLASMPPEALAAPVPTVPGWTLEHVVRHTGKVHRWAAAVILAGAGADTGAVAKQQVESLPKGPDCLPAYRDSLDAVIATFESVAPDSAVETFVGTRTASWWLRRQAHEVAVHRIDAADAVRAAGGAAPAALDPAAAADAVAELTEVQYPHRLLLDRLTPGSIGRTVHVHGTDVDDLEWMFTLGSSGLTSTRGHGRADVALRGSAEHLLLVLWRRRPLDVLTVFGDTSVAASLIDASRF